MPEPRWWPEWEAYKVLQREYEQAVEAMSLVSDNPEYERLAMDRIRREIASKRNSAFEAFRVKLQRK